MSEYIAKASIEPRDYRVVFLIQKTGHFIRDRHCIRRNLRYFIALIYWQTSCNSAAIRVPPYRLGRYAVWQ